MVIFQTLYWLAVVIFAAATLLPFLKVHHGAIRGLAFPRLQWFWLGILLIGLAFVLLRGDARIWATVLLAILVFIHAGYITKFTPIWPKQSQDADDSVQADVDNHVSILAANIKKSNRKYDGLIDYVRDCQPDIVIVVEPDAEWIAALDPLRGDYEHWITAPQDNGYGLCVMSKLDVTDHEIRCLITKDVISIRATVVLRSGKRIRLYVVHPEPPIASHDTEGRDSEIALAGIEARDDDLPAIVTGDLNDVAWSTTTRQFQRVSRLLDPRVGRGFFNTFHAGIPITRWPLDHLFHTARFRLLEMERGPNIHSDHFPVLFKLALAPNSEGEDQVQDEIEGEEEEAREMIRSEQRKSRDPIGDDWEDED